MATFRYRAATPTGEVRTGVLEGTSGDDVLQQVRRLGLAPIEASRTSSASGAPAKLRVDAGARQAMINATAELAVLLDAGLPLERALSVCVGNILSPPVAAVFARIHARVKEGAPLSQAIAGSPGLFPPMAAAMCEAGEADGRLGAALSRLAESLDRTEALRQTVVSSLVYPSILIVVATSVVLVMLLVVVPQFEGLFAGERGKLPFITRLVMAASEAVRAYGWAAVVAIVVGVIALRQWLKAPQVRRAFDRFILEVPHIGPLVTNSETAILARTLGSLVEGGVALPTALGIAGKSISNSHIAAAVAKVAAGLKEGSGLSRPLAATGVFPPMALSFLRTGEETAQLGMMLIRLADVLDRAVRSAIGRLIAILTPTITVLMGAVVATTIASIMSAILGFNDLALAP